MPKILKAKRRKTRTKAKTKPTTRTKAVCSSPAHVRPKAEIRHLIRSPRRRGREHEIAEAIRSIYSATHNCAEGAGAAALAALCKERGRLQGRRVAVILTGQNIDRALMQTVLAGGTPKV